MTAASDVDTSVDDRDHLRTALAAEPSVADGVITTRFPIEAIRLEQAVARALIAAGVTDDALPLDTLHERVPADVVRATPAITSTAGAPDLREAYLGLVRFLAREVLGYDVVFQDNPSLRLHFPAPATDGVHGDGRGLSYHCDILSGDPIEQINCWLPLGRSDATNAPHYVPWELSQRRLFEYAESIDFRRKVLGRSRTRFFDFLGGHRPRPDNILRCRALPMTYGEVALFDGRLLHGLVDNREDLTRVSIDFRLLAIDAWQRQVDRFERGDLAPCYPWQEPHKGRFFHSRTAFEL